MKEFFVHVTGVMWSKITLEAAFPGITTFRVYREGLNEWVMTGTASDWRGEGSCLAMAILMLLGQAGKTPQDRFTPIHLRPIGSTTYRLEVVMSGQGFGYELWPGSLDPDCKATGGMCPNPAPPYASYSEALYRGIEHMLSRERRGA